ncbi:hypothetical protein [Flavihumibacter profundi]|uniref:hypothetical protein n=1 Tax=Flavihumibacter profundi TaxID=2716883 RepID=UPI001CC3E940|nr:hypothetical protein [Flavihumibacter profundi]MBZ5859019.1 hypothetical protein [Flavihumibacter profundi]
MRKSIVVFATVLCASLSLRAQELRLNAYAGYVFDDRVDGYTSNTNYYDATIKGGFTWGAGLEYMLGKEQGVELSYIRQDTKAPTTYFDYTSIPQGTKQKEFDMALNWIMLGGNHYFVNNPKVEPYFGMQLGAAIIDVSNTVEGGSGSATKFAWGFRGGVNVWASEKVGIKLQANLMSAVQAFGAGLYVGTGGGGAGVSTYSSMLQFGLGGGLVFRLKSK